MPSQKLPTARMTGESRRARLFLFLAFTVRLVFSCWWKTTDDPMLKFKPAFFQIPLCFINDYLKVSNVFFVTRGLCPCCFFFNASMNYVTGWRGKGSWAPLFGSFAEKNVNKNGMGSIYFWTHVHSLSSQELDEKTNQYHSLDCAELSQEGS